MIHLYNGSSFKVKKYQTSEHLIKALEIDYFNKQEEFDKLVERGNNVYCCILPKMEEEDDNDMVWDSNSKKIEDLYWLVADEI